MNDIGSQSVFNEAVLKMQRLDELQERLNLLNLDPTALNEFTGQYNFKSITNTLKSLLAEVWGKLSNLEKQNGLRLLKIIKSAMKNKPIFITTKTGKKFNNENWEYIEELLFSYELLIRQYLEDHDLATPNAEAEEDFD